MSAALLAQARRHLAAGAVDDALAALRLAERAEPRSAAIPHDIGYLALRQGRWTEAAAAFERALAIDPGFAPAALRLGVARQAGGAPEAALAAFEKAARLAPGQADAPFRRGALLEALGRWPEAEAAYATAASVRPATALARLGAVRLLLARDRLGEAEDAARALLAVDPGHVEATDTLGSILADRGALAEAAACFEAAMRASSAFAGSFYELVHCRRLGAADDALVAAMTATSPTLHPEARGRVELALGKVADDRGDPAAAMRHFARADAARREARPGDAGPERIERRVDRVIARFDAERVRRAAARVPTGDRLPILVMGLPRSGTTLVEQILSSHPDVGGAGELPFWAQAGAAAEAGGFAGEAIGRSGTEYLAVLRRRVPGRARVTDKAPLNLFWAGMIAEALGGAILVICRRRPIDVALSIGRTWFNPLVDIPTGGTALVRAVRAFERVADHWRAVLPPERLHEVHYEMLVTEPERVVRELLAACGLSWNEACLRPERNRRPVRTPSRWQVRAPITAPPPERWRRYEPWLGPLAALRPEG